MVKDNQYQLYLFSHQQDKTREEVSGLHCFADLAHIMCNKSET